MRAPKSRAETPAAKSFFQFENSSELNSENVTDHNSKVEHTIIRSTVVYTITITCSWLPVILLVSIKITIK